jgi:hypothetical protein
MIISLEVGKRYEMMVQLDHSTSYQNDKHPIPDYKPSMWRGS